MSFTHRNHYVPEWYQRRFFDPNAKEAKYHYLKLRPDTKTASSGHRYREKDLNFWGASRCFFEDDLYTTRFGAVENDDIEKHLFGVIDRDGPEAVEYMTDYQMSGEAGRVLKNLLVYMDAQVLRTPRGLARIKKQGGLTDHNRALMYMQGVRQMHCTMWSECQFEVIDCESCGLDLLVSDNPVTFYNRGMYPGAKGCLYPHEPDLHLLGTQTLFALGRAKLLVLTHVQFARNPAYSTKKPRPNPRMFGESMIDLRAVITGSRRLRRDEIVKVNYIIKSRADRYVASATPESLYPERELKSVHWPKLATADFLIPDPRLMSFYTSTIMSYGNGVSIAMDEYGRPATGRDMDDPERVRDMRAFFSRQERWTQLNGPLPAGMKDRYP